LAAAMYRASVLEAMPSIFAACRVEKPSICDAVSQILAFVSSASKVRVGST
jgi:hypothetical protein